MVIRNHQLNAQQLIDLDTLCASCKQLDGNIVAIYKHLLSQYRSIQGNLLYYQQEQLIGFLSLFFFYEDTCEIALMVAPESRRQRIALQMLKDVLPLIDHQQIKTLLFSTPPDLNDHWLPAQEFRYQNSEYQMQRQQREPIITPNKSLLIRPATTTDLPALCAIDKACFPLPHPAMAIRFQQLLHDPNYTLFIAEKEGVVIGKVHLYWQQDSARLTDIAILPHVQGCGFGSVMLAYCINYCLTANRSTINLDVETTNKDALNLYLRLGFTINNAYDFWTIPVERMQVK